MARECQVTGKRAVVGNRVSHANNKTKRLFKVNLQTKRFFFPEENRWITLTLSAKAIKTIAKRGIADVVATMRAQGQKI